MRCLWQNLVAIVVAIFVRGKCVRRVDGEAKDHLQPQILYKDESNETHDAKKIMRRRTRMKQVVDAETSDVTKLIRAEEILDATGDK